MFFLASSQTLKSAGVPRKAVNLQASNLNLQAYPAHFSSVIADRQVSFVPFTVEEPHREGAVGALSQIQLTVMLQVSVTGIPVITLLCYGRCKTRAAPPGTEARAFD